MKLKRPTRTDEPRPPGRPPGSRNAPPAPAVAAIPTRCPACGSTDRDAYCTCHEQEYAGIAPDGQPYTHIVRRRTRCRACGQARIDRYYEQRSGQQKE